MVLYVVIAYFVYLISLHQAGAKPVRLTIDCGPDKKNTLGVTRKVDSLFKSHDEFDVDSFCNLIHKAIPKAVKNGKFVLVEQEQDLITQSDTFNEIFQPAPRRFGATRFDDSFELPRLKLPRLKLPRINVPKLRQPKGLSLLKAPRIGKSMVFPKFREALDQESSAERMEKFKKGIQRMLHVVKVLGQVDQYLSERTRIVVDKLAKTFSD